MVRGVFVFFIAQLKNSLPNFNVGLTATEPLDVHWVEPHADGYPVRVQCSSTGREPVAIIRFQDHYEALRSVSAAVYGRTGHGRSEEPLSPLRENEGWGMPFLRGRHEKQVAPAHTVREQSGPAVPVGVREPSGMAKAQEPPSAAPTRRQTLLETYHAARQRPLDLERALAAVKLRRAAEVYCEKNEWARFTPRLPRMPVARQRFEALAALSADELIANVEAHPECYSRTLLTDIAQHHLLAALNIDVNLYEQGIHQAGLYEGLHSVAGRIVTAAASAVSLGVAEIPGAGHALKAGKKAIKVMAHELPPNIVNPALTGRLRSVTDVKEAFKRVGGQPVVAPQIEKSPNMGVIVQRLKDKRRKLNDAAKQFPGVSAAPGRDSNALGNLVDAFLDLHDTADHQYRQRIGLNRTQTYSKGWGMAINGVAATGAILTPTVPVVGQIVGPAILASTIPLQWVAGYLDERRNKHRYNFRANTKWANFLHENAAHIHFKDLKPEHISERALRQSFITQSEVQVAAIREVYEDTLGEWMHRRVELERKIGVMESTGMAARAIWPHRAHLRGLGLEIDLAKQQVEDFESFDAGRWSEIPADSPIGRCLDDLKQLEQANRAARLRKPGESAQIVQRYVQAFHAGVSTGTALPVIDAITLTDSLYARDAHGHQTALHPGAEAGAVGTGIVGGGVFTATTGEVRMSKADNKKLISELRVSPEQFRADERQWVFKAGDRTVDLRNTAGYRRHVHSTWDEFRLIGRAVRSGLFSGPAGLWHLSRAKGWPWGELRRAKAELRAALDLLAASDTPKPVAHDVARTDTLSAMKDELYDYPAVRIHLGTKGGSFP
ncbi:hypothetical protein [Paraburkholderia sp. JPY419]|uniref:hypothetical protein n=1 Tax=Paraburkholderia sp. JPY419 TaxID=667660 RepID=UPI003D1EA82A